MYSYYTKPHAACTTIIVLKFEQSVEYIVFVCACACYYPSCIYYCFCAFILPSCTFYLKYLPVYIYISILKKKYYGL